MSSGLDFRTGLQHVHNLYFKSSAGGKRLIGSSTVLGAAGEKWRLSAVLVSDGSELSYFERNLSFSDVQTLTRPLGDFTWASFFSCIKIALKSTELVFESGPASLQLYFPKGDGGLSSTIDINLAECGSHDKLAISSFLFSCIERIQTLETKLQNAESILSSSTHRAKEAVSPKKSDSTYDTGIGAIGLVGAKGGAPSSSEQKKSGGGSLLNPRAKKYVPKPNTLSGN